MKKHFGLGAAVLGAFVLVFTFQNCSGGDLPPEAQGVTPLSSTEPLRIVVPQAAMGPRSTAKLTASGGIPPYVFSIVSGPVSIDAASGLVTSVSNAGAFVARVTDAKGSTDDDSMTVDLSLAPVTSGTLDLASSGTTSWVVPTFNSLTIEVWGAGGSGGGVTNNGTAYDGKDGALSSAIGGSLNLIVAGGSKGTGCRINVGNGTPGPGGVAPTAGSTTNTAGTAATPWRVAGNGEVTQFNPSPGGMGANGGAGGTVSDYSNSRFTGRDGQIPGGGGGGAGYVDANFNYCLTGGGGGGAYLKSVFSSMSQLPAGTALSLVVGAGGATVLTGPVAPAGAGAIGKVKIVWN